MKFGKRKSADPVEALSPAVEAVLRLLREHPEDWRFDRYEITHIGGARVWVSNGAWAVYVEIPGLGRVLEQAEGCKPTRAHLELWAAITHVRHVLEASAMEKYGLKTESLRAQRQRERVVSAARLDADALAYDEAAVTARRLAEEARSES